MMIKKNMSHLLVSAVMQILTGIVSVMISRSWWQIAAEPPQISLTAAWRQLQCDEITDKFSISTHFSISALHYLFILSDSRPLGWQPEIKKICIFIIWNDILCDNSYHRSVMKYWKSYEAFLFHISYLFCECEDEDWILNEFCCKYFQIFMSHYNQFLLTTYLDINFWNFRMCFHLSIFIPATAFLLTLKYWEYASQQTVWTVWSGSTLEIYIPFMWYVANIELSYWNINMTQIQNRSRHCWWWCKESGMCGTLCKSSNKQLQVVERDLNSAALLLREEVV